MLRLNDGTPQDDAIADEMEFHMDACAAELMRAGMTADAARAEALRRFGDIQAHAEACRRQAPGAQMSRMMKVVVAFGMGCMALALAGTGYLVLEQRRELAHAAATRAQMQSKLGEMNLELAQLRGKTSGGEVQPGVVYVDGSVARPGVYSLPPVGELRASRLVVAAGGAKVGGHLMVEPSSEHDERIQAWQAQGAEIAAGSHKRPALRVPLAADGRVQGVDPVLRAYDLVMVVARDSVER